MPRTRCAGVVLGGGLSTRMGQDKARLVTPEGETLLARTIRIVSEVANQGCWLSGVSGDTSHPVVSDVRPGCGPAAGIFSSLQALCSRADMLLLVPVDMPGIHSRVLEMLVEACSIDDVEAAFYKAHPLPLAIRTQTRCIEAAKATLESEHSSVKSLLKKLKVSELDSSTETRSLSNVNTPEEWKRFWARSDP